MNGKHICLGCAFVGAISVILCGCKYIPRFSRDKEADIRIGLAVYQEKDSFLASILEEVNQIKEEWEEENDGVIQINIADGQGDQIIQNEQIEKFVSLKYDVICVNLVDRTSAASIIEQASDAGIPLVFYNREPVEEDIFWKDQVYYIGSDPKESAILQAEIIRDAYEKDAKIIDKNQDGVIEYAMLEGEQGHQDAIIRTKYSVKALEDMGFTLKRVAGGNANFNRSQAAAITEQFLEENSNIELIISNNDEMALGAFDALEKLNVEDVNIVGIDGTIQAKEAVLQEKLLGTVVSDYSLYAQTIFDVCYALAAGENVEEACTLDQGRYVWIPWEKYTAE